ncbi:hypothetical protein B1207_14580 [Legionella quinlivanii]|uniref:YhcG N-terminal domain-containing protein n=1 Tax=Legionella quinlivanii TaxID=45073 RepID=A0A364LFS4_9GAMM|nr:hypothetical protein B1207_14580 [Legionella quinlivanii]
MLYNCVCAQTQLRGKKLDKELSHINEDQLYSDVSQLIEITRQKTLHEVNRAGVLLYWHIGRRINRDILKCSRAEYGANIIKTLAEKLQTAFGRGFGVRVIHRCVQFERFFSDEKIVLSLSEHLKWTHFVSLLNITNQLKREFYAEMCRVEKWSTRELANRIDEMLFERTAIAKKPEEIIEKEILKLRETHVPDTDFIIQDPYIFSYLNAEVLKDEKTLEDAILSCNGQVNSDTYLNNLLNKIHPC